MDRVIQHLDGDLRVGHRHRRAGPDAAGIFALSAGHLLVPLHRRVAALFRRQIGEGDRERPDRADDAHFVAEPVHMFELLVEIEPLRPGIQRRPALMSDIIVAAAGIFLRTADKSLRLQKRLEHAARPPVEMRVDDFHTAAPDCAALARRCLTQFHSIAWVPGGRLTALAKKSVRSAPRSRRSHLPCN